MGQGGWVRQVVGAWGRVDRRLGKVVGWGKGQSTAIVDGLKTTTVGKLHLLVK